MAPIRRDGCAGPISRSSGRRIARLRSSNVKSRAQSPSCRPGGTMLGSAVDRRFWTRVDVFIPVVAGREKRSTEELRRVLVFRRAFAQMHLPQIGGKLRLLIAAARHVVVRHHDLAPWFQAADHARFDGCAGRLSLFAARLVVKAHTQQLHLHLLDVVGLGRGNSGQQAADGIKGAVGRCHPSASAVPRRPIRGCSCCPG